MAYAVLGLISAAIGEQNLAKENIQKAFDLRNQVSDREKLYIEWLYYTGITGELEKALQTLELWVQTYSRDGGARNYLGFTYFYLGQYERALTEFGEARRLNGSSSQYLTSYVNALLCLNRLEDAQKAAIQTRTQKLDSPDLRYVIYFLAFLQKDTSEMNQQLAYAADKPAIESWFLEAEADTAAYGGRLEKAREFTRQAVESAQNADQKEEAATYEAASAVREALFGNLERAKQQAAKTSQFATGGDVEYLAALAFAIAGDSAKGQALAEDMAKKESAATLMRFKYVPTVYAQLALANRDATRAIETLRSSSPYELGSTGTSGAANLSLHAVYVRGVAYLASRQRGHYRVPENSRPPRHCLELTHRCTCSSPTWSRLRHAGRHRQGQSGLSGFPYAVERRRPRHPDPEASHSRVREPAIAGLRLTFASVRPTISGNGDFLPVCRSWRLA